MFKSIHDDSKEKQIITFNSTGLFMHRYTQDGSNVIVEHWDYEFQYWSMGTWNPDTDVDTLTKSNSNERILSKNEFKMMKKGDF